MLFPDFVLHFFCMSKSFTGHDFGNTFATRIRYQNFDSSYLEVNGKVKALPDEEALDEATARQTIFVQVDSVQTAVGLIMTPGLITI